MDEYQNRREQLTSPLIATVNNTPAAYFSSLTAELLFSAFVAVCGSFNYGLAVGYSSPVESEIIDDLGLSTAEYSLFGSLITIGGALGAIACGKMSDYIGRKVTLGVTDVISIAGWISIVAAQGVFPLYIGRLILGIALGISTYVIPIYIAEISPKDHRGAFVILHLLVSTIGASTAYILGVFISWRVLAAIGVIPNLAQLIGLFFIPESPRWLMKARKEEKFQAALQRFRGSSADISIEAAEIKEYSEVLDQTSKGSIFELFQRKYAYTLTIGVGLFALSQLVGTNGVYYYATSIFELAGLSSKLGTILMAIVQVISAVVSLLLMDRFGRRPLLMVSASGLCLACLLVGISFVLQDHGWIEEFSPYLALIGILMFCSFYCVGIGGIISLLMSEIYPINIKGLAGSVTTFVGWMTSALVTYTFNFSISWSSAGTFFIFAGFSALTLVFVVVLVPETKGRTLEEIQYSLDQRFRSASDGNLP